MQLDVQFTTHDELRGCDRLGHPIPLGYSNTRSHIQLGGIDRQHGKLTIDTYCTLQYTRSIHIYSVSGSTVSAAQRLPISSFRK
jgi:hypothetical protein